MSQPSRVKISLNLSESPSEKLWWPLPTPPTSVVRLVQGVLAAAGAKGTSPEAVAVTLGGFEILLCSDTALLRDGDVLEFRRRGKRKRDTTTPSSTEIQKDSDAAAEQAEEEEKRQPSRSARRKAAKRRRRREGLDGPDAAGPRQLASELQKEETTQKPQKELSESSSSDDSSSSSDDSSSSSDSSSSEDSSGSDDSSSSEDSSSSSDDSSSSSSDEESEGELAGKTNTGVPVPQPVMTEEDFAALMPCNGTPTVDSVVAYKLLEIGSDFAPRISEVRQGRVIVGDAAMLTLEPYPDPLRVQQGLEAGEEVLYGDGEEEEEEEGPPSSYDEAGILVAELSSFAELRYVLQKEEERKEGAGDGDGIEARQQLEKDEKASDAVEYSRLGPPRPRKAADIGPLPKTPIGDSAASIEIGGTDVNLGWLVGQLQQRRAELSGGKEIGSKERIGVGGGNGDRMQLRPRKRAGGKAQAGVGSILRMLRGNMELLQE